MKSDLQPLLDLTGLMPKDLANAIGSNPRAYMALKGAVAEKHLEIYLESLLKKRQISSLRPGGSDFEKDFYVNVKGKKKHIIIECKNVEVIKATKKSDVIAFFEFLISSQAIHNSKKVRK